MENNAARGCCFGLLITGVVILMVLIIMSYAMG